MKSRNFLKVFAITALIAILVMPASGFTASKKIMTFGTASMGGAYYPVGTGMATIINKYLPELDVRVEVTGGGLENPRLVGDGKTQLGITNLFLGHLAIEGQKPFTKKYPIVALAYMYPSTFHMVTTKKNSEIKSVEDIKGKRVAVGPAGGGTILLLKKLLTVYDFTVKDIKPSYISYKDGSMALQDGNVDAAFLLAGAPTGALKQLIVRTPIRFLDISQERIDKFLKAFPYYVQVNIPKSFYNTDKDALSVGSGNCLIVNKNMSEELAYKITAALYDHVDEFKKVHPSTSVVNLKDAPKAVIDLHPGAIRYYREKGVMK